VGDIGFFVSALTVGTTGTLRFVGGVMVVMVVTIVGVIDVAMVVIVWVATPVGRVPAPIVPVAIAVTIIIWVVAVVVAIVVWIVPAAEHTRNVAGLHPHLVAHNHNGVECGVVGERQEVGVAIAVVPIGGGHTVGQRGETLQPTRIGAGVVIHVDVVVGDVDISRLGGDNRTRGAAFTLANNHVA